MHAQKQNKNLQKEDQQSWSNISRYPASTMLLMAQRTTFCGKTVIFELKSDAEEMDSECEEVLVTNNFFHSHDLLLVLKSDITYVTIILIMTANLI